MNPDHLVVALCAALAAIVGLLLLVAWLLDRLKDQREWVASWKRANDSLWCEVMARARHNGEPTPLRPPEPPEPKGRKL